jgi:hypothetical protein
MQALTPHAYAQVARALRPLPRTGTGRGLSVEISRHMPYMKDLQWLSGEAAYQNS